MTASVADDAVAAAFEQQRTRLTAVAYRVLGSRDDAEDAVQEAWLRLARQDAGAIDNLSAWLTTVVGRVCIDMLRSRTARAETAYGDEPPEWIVTPDETAAPESNAVLADSVGVALLVVLDSLGPDERLAFVLHDMFAVPFDEIGQIVGKSTDAAKMLASRARRKVQGQGHGAQHPTDRRRQGEVVDAFLAAAQRGDFEGLLRVLDPDVVWRIHSPRGEIVRLGATELATQAARGGRAKVVARRVLVNGEPGLAAWRLSGQPMGVMACTVVDDRIVEVESVTDPERLAAMGLDALVVD
jgi:RNA polymerase sigma-70 factor (ECF subfamily)